MIENFQLVKKLGTGGFGTVWKVVQHETGAIYALKVMNKAKIISKKSVKAVLLERVILSSLLQDKSDFIVNIRCSSQDTNKLYILMDYIQGRTLRSYLDSSAKFTEDEIKYIVINLLKALGYLHKRKIIHRDIKPQNIIIDKYGHPHLTDFGIASYFEEDNSNHNGGTLFYMAPEILQEQDHCYAVDYYALGIITYELFFKKRPYEAESRQQLLKKIIKNPVDSKIHQSPNVADFISKLLCRKQKDRLGFRGNTEILEHSWLKDHKQFLDSFNWDSEKWSNQPSSPEVEQQIEEVVEEVISKLLEREHIQLMFKDFDFIPALQTRNLQYKEALCFSQAQPTEESCSRHISA